MSDRRSVHSLSFLSAAALLFAGCHGSTLATAAGPNPSARAGIAGSGDSAASKLPDVATVTTASHTPTAASPSPVSPESTFGHLVAKLSEPGGFFQSENVVSNETSYLLVMDAMRRLDIHGGAYIGVGPDQNFSYIAAVKPEIAFMFDIRRDNLLEHLMFKAIFAMTRDRVEYLSTLLAKPAPSNPDSWRDSSVSALMTYIDRTPTSTDIAVKTQQEIDRRVAAFGVPLDDQDIGVVHQYRAAFVRDGLDVQYSSIDNSPARGMPGWRDLLVETDRSGHQLNYFASEDAFQYIKSMEARNLIVPVTGNVAGPIALPAVAREIAGRGLKVSVFYMSNVEQYLMQNATFPVFAENVKKLPRDSKSVFIRSIFGTSGAYRYSPHPLSVAGYNSTQILQYIDTFVTEWDAGQIVTYQDLTSMGWIGP